MWPRLSHRVAARRKTCGRVSGSRQLSTYVKNTGSRGLSASQLASWETRSSRTMIVMVTGDDGVAERLRQARVHRWSVWAGGTPRAAD
jgi:hypothetical protein